MMSAIISIVIPVYNSANYIEQCLSSIKNQTFQDYEVIIINDGSTDHSASLIRWAIEGDSRFHYCYQPNSGVSCARNKGLELASGNYILFIDSDDYIAPSYLEHIVYQVVDNPADLYVWGLTYLYGENHQQVVIPKQKGKVDRHTFINLFVKEQYVENNSIYGYIANKLIKRAIVSEHHLSFNVGQTLMEDYDFFLSYYSYIDNAYCFDESGYFYNKKFEVNRQLRIVNYQSLIDVHHHCQLLMNDNEVIDEDVHKVINKYIGNLALSMFLEMYPANYSTICDEVKELFMKDYPIYGLKESSNKRRVLRFFVLHKMNTLIYLYLLVWNSYLKIRGVR